MFTRSGVKTSVISFAFQAATQDTEKTIEFDTEQQSKVHEVENVLPNEGLPIFVQVEVLKPKDVFVSFRNMTISVRA